ncbi:MAG: hypothetical protein ACLUOA_12810 [Gemmiger formicilis]|uniref:hypothetical protein n=1 Tax=Gemmiger formicilis TaxID=745368 RepID=UPI003995AC17
MCDVAIPNKEIAFVYEKEVLNRTNQNNISISISQAIFLGDTKKVTDSSGRVYVEKHIFYGWSE